MFTVQTSVYSPREFAESAFPPRNSKINNSLSHAAAPAPYSSFTKTATIAGSDTCMTDYSQMRTKPRWKTTGSSVKFVRPALKCNLR